MYDLTLLFASAASRSTLLLCLLALLGVPWLLFTEFSYLGTRIHRALYDFLAYRYDQKWRQREYASPELTNRLFVDPLRQVLDRGPSTRLLDLACGSGRISLLALKQPWFQGSIEAVDLSSRMLDRFRKSLETLPPAEQQRVHLVQGNLVAWRAPAPEQCDAVTLTEASEFLSQLPRLVEQVSCGLRPGGLFLLTVVPPAMSWMFPSRYQGRRSMTRLLQQHGFERIEFIRWMPRYWLVRAWKPAKNSV